MKVFYAVLLLLLVVQIEGQQRVGEVRFDARGINGYIRFSEVDNGVRIEANLQGLRGNHVWHIHDLPVDQTVDPALQCLGGSVGGHYDPQGRNDGAGYSGRCAANQADCEVGDLSGKFGPLMPNTLFNQVDTTGFLTLRGQFSVLGRSVVIHRHDDGDNFECGTIRSQAEMQGGGVTLLQSSLIIPIAGTVYFKQVAGEDVQIWGKLYWTNDSPTTVQHNWHIHELAPGEEYRNAVCDITPNTGNIQGHYDPFDSGPTMRPGYNESCRQNQTSGCEVGDLTGKHTQLTVSATPSPYNNNAFFFTDDFLNLTGVNTVNNRSLAIHQANGGGPVVSCAPLVMSENIVLTQYGTGDITLSQGSPFEDTVLTAANSRTDTILESSALNSPIQNCMASTPFSPYIPVEIPSPGVVTPDRYSLGTLQTRYSELSGATTQRLFDVPIYGGGVSITSHNLRTVDSDGSTCSALVPSLTDTNVIIAKASFSRVLRGAVYLIQRNNGNGQFGNTHIIVDVYYNNRDTAATRGHNWHVHMNPSPSSAMTCSPTVGGHYNPFNVSLGNSPNSMNSNYSQDCTPRYQLRCESGDLTGKHGQLDISPDGPSRPTYTYVDSDVLLAGAYSIVGRSIAIHDVAGDLPIFDCGTVRQLYPSRPVIVRVTPSDQLRTSLTTTLADAVDNLDATDILVLQQDVVSVGFGFNCVDVSVRVLAPSSDAANTYADRVREAGEAMFSCNGGSRSASITLHTTLVLPLLVAALMMLAKH